MSTLNEREHATVLAALRYYQEALSVSGNDDPDDVADIATNGGTVTPLEAEEIDALCERLNTDKPEIAIEIPNDAWEEIGSGDMPRSRLLAGITINGTHMHLEAFEVQENEEGLQVAADPLFEDDVGTMQDMNEASFQTVTIEGREYVLIATPHGN